LNKDLIKQHYYTIIYCIVFLFLVSACSTNQNKIPLQTTDFCSAIHRDSSLSLSDALNDLTHSIKNKTGVYILEDGNTAMTSRAWLCEYAEQTIDIQYFIFSTDNVGLIACDYIVRAANRGVKVRLLIDDILVDARIEDILTLSSHPNIELKIYNPGVNLGKNIFQKIKRFATDFRGANQRMHNKTFIVDNKVVITGGRNIADEYFDYDHEYNFRDRDVFLLGKIAPQITNSFNQFWESNLSVPVEKIVSTHEINSADSGRFDNLHLYACNPDNFWPQVREKITQLPQAFKTIQQSGELVWLDSLQFVSDIPGKNKTTKGLGGGGNTTNALIKLVQQAKHSIDIQSPYLITSEQSRLLFKKATARGVKVRILTNSLASTDNVEAFSGYQRDRNKLLACGVRIFEYKPDAAIRKKIMTNALQEKMNFTPIFGLHAKSMVIDSQTTVIGTFNLDPRSANLNTECIVIIPSKKIASMVLLGMNEEFEPENAWETTNTFNPDNKVKKTKQLKSWTRKIVPKGIL
jgi:cardiolipin synthase C